MNVEEYLSQNQESIAQQCKAIVQEGSNPIITVKKKAKTGLVR